MFNTKKQYKISNYFIFQGRRINFKSYTDDLEEVFTQTKSSPQSSNSSTSSSPIWNFPVNFNKDKTTKQPSPIPQLQSTTTFKEAIATLPFVLHNDQIQACSSSFHEQPLLNQPLNLLQTNKPTANTSLDGLVNQIQPLGASDKHPQSRGNVKHILATKPSATIQSFWVDRYQNCHNLSCKPNVTNKQELSNFQNMNINSFSEYPTNVNHGHLSTFKHRSLHSQREIVSKPGSSIDPKPYVGKNTASL